MMEEKKTLIYCIYIYNTIMIIKILHPSSHFKSIFLFFLKKKLFNINFITLVLVLLLLYYKVKHIYIYNYIKTYIKTYIIIYIEYTIKHKCIQ